MRILNCLRNDPAIIADAQQAVVGIITDLAARGQFLDFMTVYGVMLEKGMEVDIESATVLYDKSRVDARTRIGDVDEQMTTPQDLDAIVDGEINKALRRTRATKAKAGKKIETQDLAKSVAKSLYDVLNNKLYGGFRGTTADKAIKAEVLRYAKSVLGEGAVKGKTWEQLLADVIAKSALNLNSQAWGAVGAEDIWNQVKPALNAMAARIADPAVRAAFDNEIQKIMTATFNLGITTGKRKKILYGLIAAGKYGKTLRNGKKVVDWNKMMQAGNLVDELRSSIDDELKRMGFDVDHREKIYEALAADVQNLQSATALTRAIQVQQAQQQRRQAKQQAQQQARDDKEKVAFNALVKEVAIVNGFYRLENGEKVLDFEALTSEGRDWLRDRLSDAGIRFPVGADNDVGPAFLDLVGQYVANKDYSQIRAAVSGLMMLNNKKWRAQVNRIDRLSRLLGLGIGLDTITDPLAAKIVGSRVAPEYVAELKSIVERYEALTSNAGIIQAATGLDPSLQEIPASHNPSIFASQSMLQINHDIAELIKKHVRGDKWKSLGGVIQILDGMHRMSLSARLMSVSNMSQNFTTAVANVMTTSGDSMRKTEDMIADMWKEYVAVQTGNPTTSDAFDIRRAQDVDTWFHADSTGKKIWGALKTTAEGYLNGVDSASAVAATRNLMYFTIHMELNEKLRLRFPDDARRQAEIQRIMEPYVDLKAKAKARQMAATALDIVGISPQRNGERAYAMELARETKNMEFALLMSGELSDYISPIRLRTYYKNVGERVNERLGKRDVTVMAKNDTTGQYEEKNRMFMPNIIKNLITKWADEPQEEALSNYIRNPNFGTRLRLLLRSISKWLLHGGPLAFASGSFRFGDLAVMATGWGFKEMLPTVYGGEIMTALAAKKRRWLDLIGPGNPQNFNENDVSEAFKEWEIARHRYKSMIINYMVLGLVLAIELARSDDDDGDDFLERAFNQLVDDAVGNPASKLLITRILAPTVRILGAWGEAERRGKKELDKIGAAFSAIFNTRTPYGIWDIVESFKNPKTGSVDWPAVARVMTQSVFGVGDVLTWPLNFVNFWEDVRRGSPKQANYSNSPLIPDTYTNTLINGAAWGLGGRPLNLWASSQAFKDLPLLDKDEVRPFKDYLRDVKDHTFSEIDWSLYGQPGLNAKKELVMATLPKLGNIYDALLTASADLEFGFTNRRRLDLSWDDPDLGFVVSLGDSPEEIQENLARVRSYTGNQDLGETQQGSGRINMLRVIIEKWKAMGVDGASDIEIGVVETSRKFEILQNRLAGKLDK